jgi:glycosyltransferase involved in cell wall biosynthesis
MLVSLIITTYNRPEALLLALKSIENQSTNILDVIIADDGSTDETEEVIKKFQETTHLKVIHSWQANNGFRAARSRNKAIAKSLAEYIILIDGDMILHKDFVQDHINNSEKGFFIQGTRVLLSKGKTQDVLNRMKVNLSFLSNGIKNRKNLIHSNYLSKIFQKKTKYLKGIKTCNMSFFKQDCINVNGLNNDFEGWGREDTEFAARLINSGVLRKNLRFNAIQFHMWHIEHIRKSLEKNDLILKSTINSNSKWCNNGIDKYL